MEPGAEAIVGTLAGHYARLVGRSDEAGRADDAALRARLLARLEGLNDPRRERYGELLAVTNGWPAPQSLTPVADWATQAVRALGP